MNELGSRLARTLLLASSILLPAVLAIGQRVPWQLHVSGLH